MWQINPMHIKDLCAAGIACSERELFNPEVNLKAAVWVLDNSSSMGMDDVESLDDKLRRYYGTNATPEETKKYIDRIKSRLGHIWSMYYFAKEQQKPISPPTFHIVSLTNDTAKVS